MHKRHILPKDEDRRLLHPRDPTQMSYYPHKPIMAFPPYHYNNAVSMPSVYPMWGQLTGHPANIQMWGPPSYPPWQPSESWHWKPSYPGVIMLVILRSKVNLFCKACYSLGRSFDICIILILQLHADAWGCPVMSQPLQGGYSSYPQVSMPMKMSTLCFCTRHLIFFFFSNLLILFHTHCFYTADCSRGSQYKCSR